MILYYSTGALKKMCIMRTQKGTKWYKIFLCIDLPMPMNISEVLKLIFFSMLEQKSLTYFALANVN